MGEIEEKNDDLSFKNTISGFREGVKYLISKWWIMMITGIIGGALGLLIATKTKATYTGRLTFVLSSESKGGGLSGLASQFGLDLGGSSSNDVFSGDNILTLFKSERLVKKVLFKKPPERDEILANIIVKDWQWDKKWQENKRTQNTFPFPLYEEQLSPIQDSLLREVHTSILEKNLNVARTDKKLSVYEVSTTSTNELFSCYLTRFLMDETARFYIETKTRLARQNLEMIEREEDSIRSLLSGSIVSTASEVDRTYNLNPALQRQRATVQKGQVRSTVLGTVYGEVVKNLELARINLQKETPLYQLIDVPELPLKIKKPSKMLLIIKGAAFLIFLTTLFL